MKRGLITGAAIFVAGFGVMNALWRLGDWPKDIRGLWDYRSATIGDGLLLPVAAGILVSARQRLPPAAKERALAAVFAVVGATAGAASQYVWLGDDHPELNWTFPEAHRFNAAGWYHAVFLTAASSFFAWALFGVLYRLRGVHATEPQLVQSRIRSPWTALLIGCLVGFVGLSLLDGSQSMETTSTIASMIAVAVAMVAGAALLLWAVGFPTVKGAWRTLSLRTLLALGLCWLTLNWSRGVALSDGDIFVTTMLSVALIVQLWAWKDPKASILFLTFGLWTIGSFRVAAMIEGTGWFGLFERTVAFVVCLAALFFALIFLCNDERDAVEGRILCLVVWIPLFLMGAADLIAQYPGWAISTGTLDSFVTVVIIACLVRMGRTRYMLLLRDERNDDISPGDLETSFLATWGTFASILTATLGAFCFLITQSRDSLAWELDAASPSSKRLVLLLFLVACTVAGLLGVWLSKTAMRQRRWRLEVERVREGQEGQRSSRWRALAHRFKHFFIPELAGKVEGSIVSIKGPHLSMPFRSWLVVMTAVSMWLFAPLAMSFGDPAELQRTGLFAHGASGRIMAFGWFLVAIWMATITGLSFAGNLKWNEYSSAGRRETLLMVWATTSVFVNTLWLCTAGIWNGSDLARLMDIAALTGMVVMGNVVVVAVTAWAITLPPRGTAGEPHYISLHHPAVNCFHDLLLHGALLGFTVLIFYVAARWVDRPQAAIAAIALFPIVGTILDLTVLSGNVFKEHIAYERARPSLFDRLTDRDVSPADADIVMNLRADAIAHRAELTNTLAYAFVWGLLLARASTWVVYSFLRWLFQGLPDPSAAVEVPDDA